MKALIVAGEASGDIYGGELAAVLLQRIPDLHISGMGGDRMQQAGVNLLHHFHSVAVVGVFEVASKLKKLREALGKLTHWINENRPEFAILIDFPDFNFRLARFLKERGIRIFYFISPQIWAWRKSRIHFLKDHVDLMVSVLPFEKSIYDAEGIPTVYVGHPLVEIVQRELQEQSAFSRGAKPLVGLMPGSRDSEIRRHLPVLLKTVELIKKEIDIDVILIRAPSVPAELFDVPANVQLITRDRYAAMQACDFMLVASGTSTLETAILNVPFFIVYKVGSLSWYIGKILVRVPYYGLVNWIAQKKVVPEFIQDRMNPALLADHTIRCLRDPASRKQFQESLLPVVKSLGEPGAMQRAADAILALL